MIVALVCFAILIWILWNSFSRKKQVLVELDLNIEKIRQRLYAIAQQAKVSIPNEFSVLESDYPYTRNKTTIHLPIRKGSILYDDNTLMHVAIHELAHVICPTEDTKNHGPVFLSIEKHLQESSSFLGFYDPEKPIDDSYPCGE